MSIVHQKSENSVLSVKGCTKYYYTFWWVSELLNHCIAQGINFYVSIILSALCLHAKRERDRKTDRERERERERERRERERERERGVITMKVD